MTQITTTWKKIKEVYVGNDGYHDVYWRMYARIASETTSAVAVQVQGRLYLTGSSGNIYLGATSTTGGSVGSVSQWGVNIVGTYYTGETTLWDNNASVSKTTGSVDAGVRFYSSPWGWTGENLYLSDTLTFSTPPTTPTISASSVGTTSTSVTYGTTSFGTAGSGTVYLYGGTSSTPTTQLASKTTTGNSTYSHSSLNANTRYYYRARAYSSVGWSDYSSTVNTVTRSGAASWSVSSFTSTSVTISYTTRAGGGVYAQNMQYSLDGGTTWVTGATVPAGTTAGTTGTFTISGLAQATTYTIRTRVLTTVGSAVGTTLTVTTATPPSGGSLTVTNRTWNTISLSGSITSWGSPSDATVNALKLGVSNNSSVEGKPRREYGGSLNSMSASGTVSNSSTALSGGFTLCGGAVVYPYLYARNGAIGTYLVKLSAVRLPPAPISTFQVQSQRKEANSSITATLKLVGGATDGSINASGLKVTTYYRYRISGESFTSWIKYVDSEGEEAFYADDTWPITLSGLSPNTEYEVQAYQYVGGRSSETKILTFTTIEDQVIPVSYSVELWSWSQNKIVFDLSPYIVGNLEMTWTLNDIEEVTFEVDIAQLEQDWIASGYSVNELLRPYSYDIKIRRDSTYIMGCNLVQVNYKVTNNPPVLAEIRGTGFLNIFKDQYILDVAWGGYTYSEIARKIVALCQESDNMIKNGTFDIDTSYWLTIDGTLSQITSSVMSGSGAGYGIGINPNTWMQIGTQLKNNPGTRVHVDFWVRPMSSSTKYVYIECRDYLTHDANQRYMNGYTDLVYNSWYHVIFDARLDYEDCWFTIMVGSNTSGVAPQFIIDDIKCFSIEDRGGTTSTEINNHKIEVNIDTATSTQSKTRQANYELQNAKDAIMNLTSQSEDNFDFEFTYDRKFNVYSRKGSDKLDLGATYPGNIKSMNISRDASNLANKMIVIGSGIGDERLQVELPNNVSRRAYGTRESVVTKNNVSLQSTLISETVGELYDRKNPILLPSVVVEDGSLNPSNIQTGDSILVSAKGSGVLNSINDYYRIQKIKTTVTPESVEEMHLTFMQPTQRPTPYMVRYIKDVMYGNSVNNYNFWVELEALMLVGNEYVNVALGKTVTATSGGTNLSRITDGDLNTSNYAYTASGEGIIVDLGAEYPIDYIRVWHYYGDGRRFKGEHLSVGATLTSGTTDLSKVLFSFAQTSAEFVETSSGITSPWIQSNNIVEGGTI